VATAVLAAGLLAAMPVCVRAQIVNGGFETGTTAGWTLTGDGGVSTYAAYDGIGLTGDTTPDGNFMFVFNGGNTTPNAVLSQTIATNPGEEYLITFDYGDFNISNAPSEQSVLVSAEDVATSTGLLGATITQSTPTNQTDIGQIYGPGVGVGFFAIGTETTIAFSDTPASETNGSDGLLDNVSVHGVVAAPEPSSLAFLTFTAVGLVAGRRRIGRKS
jgi:hypothetical protein